MKIYIRGEILVTWGDPGYMGRFWLRGEILVTWGDPGYVGRSWLRDHGAIKTGPEILEQKGNILSVVRSTMCSTLNVFTPS